MDNDDKRGLMEYQRLAELSFNEAKDELAKAILDLRKKQGRLTEKALMLDLELRKLELYKKLELADEELADVSTQVKDLEDLFKELAVKDYLAKIKAWDQDQSQPIPVKKYPGLMIKQRASFTYDEPKIIAWLRAHGHNELVKETVDKIGVKKLATVLQVDGVGTSISTYGSWDGMLEEALDEAL